MTRAPTKSFVTPVEDSRRWQHVERRAGDIVVSTPPKSGTTWMQGILCSLVFADVDDPPSWGDVSPWIDARWRPVDELAATLQAMEHRRVLKTHSPATAIPFDPDVSYVTVYRDGRDALASWANHRRALKPEAIEVANGLAAADGIEPLEPTWDGDMDALIDEWARFCSPTSHLASWWPLRTEPNVHFAHYNDLQTDLEGEMRRLAGLLDIGVGEDRWPVVVERCGIGEMREAARTIGIDGAFEGGADAFFYKGTNGRWREMLTDAQLERYQRMVADELPADAATWLEHGSLALGERPGG